MRPAFPQVTFRLVAGDDIEVSVDIAYPPERNAGLPYRDEDIAHDLAAGLPVPQEIVREAKNAPVIQVIENPESIVIVLAHGNKQIVKVFFLHVGLIKTFQPQK